MSALRKNVASQVLTFNLVNATSGAALTGATVTTKVALDGTQSAGAGTITELGTGQYKYVPTQGETNGSSVGCSFTATNAIPVNLHCFTIGQDPSLATLDANVTKWNGTAVSAPATAGIPEVNIKNFNNVSAASVTTVNANQGTTQPINFTGTAGSALVKGDVLDWNSTAVATPITAGVPLVEWTPSPAELTGTATASGANTLTLAAAASATISFYNGMIILITSGTGKGQARLISAYSNTKVATVTPAWTTTPASNATYIIYPFGQADLEVLLVGNSTTGAAVTAATAGIPDVNTKNLNNVSTSSVTTINANQGTTQPLNFTGSGASALVKSDMVDVAGAAVATGTAQIGVNAVNWAGGAIPAPNVTGVPKSDVVDWLGSAPNALVSGRVDTSTGAMAANVVTAAAVADAAIDRATFAVDTGLQSVRSNTAAGGGASTITLDAAASATDSIYNGQIVYLTGATGVGQSRVIVGYVGATKVATVDRAWQTNPDATSTFAIHPTDAAKMDSSLRSTDVNSANLDTTVSSRMATFTLPTNFSSLVVDVNGRVDVSKWLGAAVNALISGRVDANAQVVGTGAIVAGSFAANAIDTTAVAASAGTKIFATACTEPTAPPASGPTALAALSWLLTLSRNKITQTSTTQLLLADDSSTTVATRTVSDDGTTFIITKAA